MVDVCLVVTQDDSTAGDTDILKKWNIKTLELETAYSDFMNQVLTAIKITKDNKYVLFATKDAYQLQYNLQSKEVIMNYGKIHEKTIRVIHQSNDNSQMWTASDDCTMKQWDLKEQKQIHEYEKQKHGPINCIATMI